MTIPVSNLVAIFLITFTVGLVLGLIIMDPSKNEEEKETKQPMLTIANGKCVFCGKEVGN